MPARHSVMADLPARSGLGDSLSFIVGLINQIVHVKGRRATKLNLAHAGVHVECDLLAENVGVQDQYHVAFSRLNRFDSTASGSGSPCADDSFVLRGARHVLVSAL
jgi:galactokinase/mevalonate kinase-like predicted kinase